MPQYLRARQGNVEAAAGMVRHYVTWRGEHCPDWPPLPNSDLSLITPELGVGKVYILEHTDKKGRPCAVVRARLHKQHSNALVNPRIVVHVLDMVRAHTNQETRKQATLVAQNTSCMRTQLVARMSAGQEQFVGIFDLAGFGYGNMDTPMTKQLLIILGKYYPERLAELWILNEGWVFWVA